MSSLLDQLRKRQNETVQSAGVQSIHVKASLLFDKKDAAKIELDAVYQLALGGLEMLKKLEPRLKPFEATLFSPSTKELSRELQSKEANDRLDESINTFLSLLAPFFLEKHAHKVLEYLIRRYRCVVLPSPFFHLSSLFNARLVCPQAGIGAERFYWTTTEKILSRRFFKVFLSDFNTHTCRAISHPANQTTFLQSPITIRD